MPTDTTTAPPELQATCAECGGPFSPGGCPSCGLADDLHDARFASVAGCSPKCAGSHWLNRNGSGVDWHSCQRGGVVSGVKRRERTRERNAEWVALYRQGLSMRQIAALSGRAASTVSRVLRERLKRRPEVSVGSSKASPAHAHTRSAPLDHVRAAQRRLNRLSRARGLRCEPARTPRPPLALAARCTPARPPWPPSVTQWRPAGTEGNASTGKQFPTEKPTLLGVARWQKKETGRADFAGVVETVGNPCQIGFSTEVVAQPFRRL